MSNTRKIIIIVLAGLAVVIAVGLSYWLINKDGVETGPVLTNINQAGPGLPAGGPGDGELPAGQFKTVTQTDRDKIELQNRVNFFVAMLGTYSPDAKFQNVVDLKPMMTAKMQDWADDFITRNLAGLAENDEKVTTQVFGTEILSYSERCAEVLVQTRRDKTNNEGHKLYGQEAEIEMVKIGDKWLVDEVEWK